jgi:hypothetical protein
MYPSGHLLSRVTPRINGLDDNRTSLGIGKAAKRLVREPVKVNTPCWSVLLLLRFRSENILDHLVDLALAASHNYLVLHMRRTALFDHKLANREWCAPVWTLPIF